MVGNDTPQLTSQHILKAVSNFNDGKLTFGKSFDGGFYLMSFNQNTFKEFDYKNLPWQTNQLASHFLKHTFSNKENLFFLPSFKDIDSEKDAFSFSKFQISTKLIQAILLLHTYFINEIKYYFSFFQFNFHFGFFNKGSPQYFISA